MNTDLLSLIERHSYLVSHPRLSNLLKIVRLEKEMLVIHGFKADTELPYGFMGKLVRLLRKYYALYP
jgi:hypothetical protein